MARDRHFSPDELRALLPFAPVVGATEAYQAEFPPSFTSAGINMRDADRNVFHGVTVSRPEENLLVFGTAYTDGHDGRSDEDIFSVDLDSGHVVQESPSEWVKKRPEYDGTHHSPKTHFE